MAAMRAEKPGTRVRAAYAIVGLALVAGSLAACLPASIRPAPTPGPTPTPSSSPAPTPTPTPAPPTPTPAPTFFLYTVVRGDTLVSIARQFGTTGRSIAWWNRDRYPSLDPESASYNPDKLQAGWVFQILPGQVYTAPLDEGETPDPTVVPTPASPEPSEPDASVSAAP
jgi:hypothetical protein